MADRKPVVRDDDTTPKSSPTGSVPVVLPGGGNDAPPPRPDGAPPAAVPTEKDHQAALLPDLAAFGFPGAPARSPHSVPDAPSRPLNAPFGFTLSEIFGQEVSGAGSNASSGPVEPGATVAGAEDPGVGRAMERGEKLFPEIMKAFGHAIRNALSSVMPVRFDTFANFGTDHLTRVAELVGRVSAMTDDLHGIDAAEQIRGIIAEANQAKGKMSLLDRVGIHRHFDPAAAGEQIDRIRSALTAELYKILKVAVDFERAMIPLNVAMAVTGILADMTEEGDIRTLVARRAELFTASAAEANMAKKQIENLQRLAQEGILQCDELKAVTLPAMGFRRSL